MMREQTISHMHNAIHNLAGSSQFRLRVELIFNVKQSVITLRRHIKTNDLLSQNEESETSYVEHREI